MLFRKLWLSLCAGALLAAHPLQAEEPTQLREVRVAYIGILPSETTEHAVYPTFDFLKSQLGHKYRFKLFDISNHDFLEEINVLKPHLLFAPSEILSSACGDSPIERSRHCCFEVGFLF